MNAPKTRRSEQRDMIRNEVFSRCDHPTAEAVYTSLHANAPNLSLGTVYRNLNLLAEQGIIRRVPIPGQPDHFDFNTTPHCHFRCVDCGGVTDLALSAAAEIPLGCVDGGYVVQSYDLVYSGFCPECAKKNIQTS